MVTPEICFVKGRTKTMILQHIIHADVITTFYLRQAIGFNLCTYPIIGE